MIQGGSEREYEREDENEWMYIDLLKSSSASPTLGGFGIFI